MLACEKLNLELVTLLLEKGAKATQKDDSGFTPIYNGRASPEILDLLLQHGANKADLAFDPLKDLSDVFENSQENDDVDAQYTHSSSENIFHTTDEEEENPEAAHSPGFWQKMLTQISKYTL